MTSDFKPIKIYGVHGPNPPKPAIVLQELGVPFETVVVPLSDVKKPEYVAINPNGRIPAMFDPNTNITLFESGAILEYIVDKYDKDNKLNFPKDTPEHYHAKQWLFYQVSGQGPYYGNMVFFKKYHHEQLPSAVERFVKEVNRVSGVLDQHLSKQKATSPTDGPWLVGNRISYADLAFAPYQLMVPRVTTTEEFNQEDYPHLSQWLKNLASRKSVQEAMDRARPQ